MSLNDLKAKATAAELCLINQVLKLQEEKSLDDFLRIFQQQVLGTTDLMMDRHAAEAIRTCMKQSVAEYYEKNP